MKAPYNWSVLRTGEAFQSLINDLLLFEFPGTRVFGRAGKDAGQDARSSDGKTVYQFKYHVEPSFSLAISDAKKEFEKIKKYRKPEAKQYPHWKDAINWIHVTNVTKNPNDEKRWDDEIVSLFKQEGLKAELWGVEHLNPFLTDHPQVTDAYFGGANRCFLSLDEAHDLSKAEAIGEIGLKVALVGRESEFQEIMSFVAGARAFLCVNGAGGIGKSRLLLEIGKEAQSKGWQVLWGLPATLEQSSNWLSAIPYTAPTLLLLDEPQSPELIEVLVEQLKTPNSQFKSWKVIVAVRSPNDPVLKALATVPQNIRAAPISLAPLTTERSLQLASALIENSSLNSQPLVRKNDAAQHLSLIADRYPIWIALAVNILAAKGSLASLPKDSNEIAKIYLDEVVNRAIQRSCTQEQLLELLRWLAIYEEIDIENSGLVSFIASQLRLTDASATIESLNSLVNRRFVVRRGLRSRLYSIKPDVMRDYTLRSWLICEVDGRREPAPSAKRLVNLLIMGYNQKPVPRIDSIILSLAKTEYFAKFDGQKLRFLDPLVDEIKRLARTGTTLQQEALLPFLDKFDFARLDDVLDIVKVLRTTEKPPGEFKDIFDHVHVVTHEDVQCQLAWPLFNAARFAGDERQRRDILLEMQEISKVEFKLKGTIRAEGKHADSLLPRIMSGENGWFPGFSQIAFDIAKTRLEHLHMSDEESEVERNLTRVFAEHFLSVERECMFYQQHSISVKRWPILLESDDGKMREALRISLRNVIRTPGAHETSKLLAWKLLSFAHSSANRSLIVPGKSPLSYILANIRNDLQGDLEWTLETLRTGNLSLSELRAARGIWDWHFRFEKNDVLKSTAAECESVYQSHPLVKQFDVFFTYDKYDEAKQRAKELGAKFGASGTAISISEFLTAASEFAPSRERMANIFEIAPYMAEYWTNNGELSAFVRAALAGPADGVQFVFAIVLLNRRFKELRDGNALSDLKRELDSAAWLTSSLEAKAELLWRLYGHPHPLVVGVLTNVDLSFMAEHVNAASTAISSGNKALFLSAAFHANWASYKELAEGVCDSAGIEQRQHCFLAIVHTMHFLDMFKVQYPQLTVASLHYDWLLQLLLGLSDIDKLEDQWELGQFVERFPKRDLDWLLAAIEARIRMSETICEHDKERLCTVPRRYRLTKFTKSIEPSDQYSARVVAQMEILLRYNDRHDTLGYYLPLYASDLDPSGVIVPALIAKRIRESVDSASDISLWTRYCGAYAFNSAPWKIMACASAEIAEKLPLDDKNAIFTTLMPQEFKTSSYPAGQMDPRPAQEVSLRREELESETEPGLAAFRKWHLDLVETMYEQALGRYREEQGE